MKENKLSKKQKKIILGLAICTLGSIGGYSIYSHYHTPDIKEVLVNNKLRAVPESYKKEVKKKAKVQILKIQKKQVKQLKK